MSEAQDIARAARADAWLNDAMTKEAFEAVRQEILNRMEACPVRDKEGLNELKLMLSLLKSVRANIEQVVNQGKVVAFEQSQRKRFRIF